MRKTKNELELLAPIKEQANEKGVINGVHFNYGQVEDIHLILGHVISQHF